MNFPRIRIDFVKQQQNLLNWLESKCVQLCMSLTCQSASQVKEGKGHSMHNTQLGVGKAERKPDHQDGSSRQKSVFPAEFL